MSNPDARARKWIIGVSMWSLVFLAILSAWPEKEAEPTPIILHDATTIPIFPLLDSTLEVRVFPECGPNTDGKLYLDDTTGRIMACDGKWRMWRTVANPDERRWASL